MQNKKTGEANLKSTGNAKADLALRQTYETAKAKFDRFGSRFNGTVAIAYLSFAGTVFYIYFFRRPMQRLYNRTIGRFLNPIINCIKKIGSCLYNCFCKCLEQPEENRQIYSDDLISELKLQPLLDILNRAKKEYQTVRMMTTEQLPWDCDPQII